MGLESEASISVKYWEWTIAELGEAKSHRVRGFWPSYNLHRELEMMGRAGAGAIAYERMQLAKSHLRRQ